MQEMHVKYSTTRHFHAFQYTIEYLKQYSRQMVWLPYDCYAHDVSFKIQLHD